MTYWDRFPVLDQVGNPTDHNGAQARVTRTEVPLAGRSATRASPALSVGQTKGAIGHLYP